MRTQTREFHVSLSAKVAYTKFFLTVHALNSCFDISNIFMVF